MFQVMRVVLGMDLRSGSTGVLRLARWLVDAGACTPEEMLAIHVIEADHLLSSVRPFGPGTLPDRLVPLVRGELDDAGLQVRAEVVEAANAEQALTDVIARHRSDLVVIGRRGTPSSFVRLGRVARRLLRRLPTAVAVVPAELKQTGIGPGPVLVATDLSPTSVPAVAFAREIAAATNTGLGTVHIVPTTDSPHTAYLRAGLEPLPEKELIEARRKRFAAWREEHGLADAEAILERGELVESLLNTAKHSGAPLVVCGSRHLPVRKRVFVSSVASTLSGLADCAVVTVGAKAED